MTDRLTKGDRVIVVNPDDPYTNRTGVIAEDDGSNLPYFVKFDGTDRRLADEWFREADLAPATYRPIAYGEYVPKGADVLVPAGLVSRHGSQLGERGPVTTFAAIDADGDLPIKMDDGTMMWFPATDCYVNASTRKAADTDGEKGTPEPGQPIRIQRRHVITLTMPVSPDDLARAAQALDPGMRVSVHTYADHIKVVGNDPEEDRG